MRANTVTDTAVAVAAVVAENVAVAIKEEVVATVSIVLFLDTVNLRFNGSQGTYPFYPLLPKSVVAIQSFFSWKALEIQIKSNSNSESNPSYRNRKTGTDRQRQVTWDRLTRTE